MVTGRVFAKVSGLRLPCTTSEKPESTLKIAQIWSDSRPHNWSQPPCRRSAHLSSNNDIVETFDLTLQRPIPVARVVPPGSVSQLSPSRPDSCHLRVDSDFCWCLCSQRFTAERIDVPRSWVGSRSWCLSGSRQAARAPRRFRSPSAMVDATASSSTLGRPGPGRAGGVDGRGSSPAAPGAGTP